MTKLLVIVSQRRSEKYIFLKSIRDTEIRRETSEREDFLLTPPWLGGTPPSPGPRGDFVQSSPGPFRPAQYQNASLLSPTPSQPREHSTSQSLMLRRELGLVFYCETVNFLITSSRRAPDFHFEPHKSCKLANYVVGLTSPRQWSSLGKETHLTFLWITSPNPSAWKASPWKESKNICCTNNEGNYRKPLFSQF